MAWEKNEFDTAYSIWLPSAERDDPRSQNAIGLLYLYGEGVEKNIPKAMTWLKRSSKLGYSEATFELAKIYDEGEGVPENNIEAISFYELAAKQGSVSALVNLGWMHDQGEGVVVNKPKALELYLEAAQRRCKCAI